MTLFEYVSNLTQNGSRVVMPRLVGCEQKTTIGEPGNLVSRVMWIHEPTFAERQEERENTGKQLKKAEGTLQRITTAAINSVNSEQWYRKCFQYCPPDVRNGAYSTDKDKWDLLLLDIVNEIANTMVNTAWTERASKGAQTILSMLQARVTAWQRQVTAKVEKEGEEGSTGGMQVTFNIT